MAKHKRGRPPMTANGRGAVCHYCKRTLAATTARSAVAATRDHLLPRWCGGERRVWACVTCNQLKGALMPGEWRAYMEANPEWWRRPRP